MSILPPEDSLELIHTRTYETRVYLVDGNTMLARAAVQDVKPPNLYIKDDPLPLEIHQMQMFMRVQMPTLEILDAGVDFETHPHSACPSIAVHYKELIGLSVARGFTHKIRELFGGPRGCTHTTALLQAMAPAVVQATWSMALRSSLESSSSEADKASAEEAHKQRIAGNLNTCHVWAEDGEHVQLIRTGGQSETMIPIAIRLAELGRSEDEWRERFTSGD